MKEHPENRHPQDAGNEAPDKGPPRGLTVEPPPQKIGPEPLYRVVYAIDIGARNPRDAAARAYQIMKDPASLPPVLDILDVQGRRTRVDLSAP